MTKRVFACFSIIFYGVPKGLYSVQDTSVVQSDDDSETTTEENNYGIEEVEAETSDDYQDVSMLHSFPKLGLVRRLAYRQSRKIIETNCLVINSGQGGHIS